MARVIGRLTAMAVLKQRMKGRYTDGGGLYLQVTARGSKSWLFRFMIDGRAHQMGLGPLHTISLADARERALECRRLRLDDIDPLEARRQKRQAARLEAVKSITFKRAAETYVRAHQAAWHNAKHRRQWLSTLATYAEPVIGGLPTQAIDTTLVLKVLEPIWTAKPETASRLRGRIEAVLDWAKVRGYRDGENPARWRGHLDKLLPKPSRIRAVAHHAALPYDDLPEFMTALHDQEGVAARALEFTILTAARTSETLGAKWDEIDLVNKMWRIPPVRMKGGKEHRVPLSRRTLDIVAAVRSAATAGERFVFPSGKAHKALSNMAMTMTLRRMGRGDLTVHGFRSAFRDWAAERTNFPREVAEMALAHAIGSKVEAAYRRGDLFNKRRQLMDDWSRYCGSEKITDQTNVVLIREG